MPASQDQPALPDQIRQLYQLFLGTPLLNILDQKVKNDGACLYFRIKKEDPFRHQNVLAAVQKLEEFGFKITDEGERDVKYYEISIANEEVGQAIKKMHGKGYSGIDNVDIFFFSLVGGGGLMGATVGATLAAIPGPIIATMIADAKLDFADVYTDLAITSMILFALIGIVIGFWVACNSNNPSVVDINPDSSVLSGCRAGLLSTSANTDIELKDLSAEQPYQSTN